MVIDFKNLCTESTTYLFYMLGELNADSVTLLNSKFPQVTSFWCLLEEAKSHIIDLSDLDTSGIKSMGNMFYYSMVKELDLSNFNTSKVTDMSNMFNGCKLLRNLNISSFDTTNVEYMTSMFYGCDSIQCLDLSKFSTKKVVSFMSMFMECKQLEELDLSNFELDSATDIRKMFRECISLKKLNISGFKIRSDVYTREANRTENMFKGCNSLEEVVLPKDEYSRLVFAEQLKADGIQCKII